MPADQVVGVLDVPQDVGVELMVVEEVRVQLREANLQVEVLVALLLELFVAAHKELDALG